MCAFTVEWAHSQIIPPAWWLVRYVANAIVTQSNHYIHTMYLFTMYTLMFKSEISWCSPFTSGRLLSAKFMYKFVMFVNKMDNWAHCCVLSNVSELIGCYTGLTYFNEQISLQVAKRSVVVFCASSRIRQIQRSWAADRTPENFSHPPLPYCKVYCWLCEHDIALLVHIFHVNQVCAISGRVVMLKLVIRCLTATRPRGPDTGIGWCCAIWIRS